MVLVDDLEQGIDVVNAYAAEHLEMHTVDAEVVATGSPTPARSSSAPGHRCRWATTAPAAPTCCPTAGCACHSSGLNVKSFLKAVHVINYDRAALPEVARHVEVFAESEDLPSHGAAVTQAFPGDSSGRRLSGRE